MSSVDRLFDLLPVHVRARDEQSGGLLAALLDAVAGELGVLERDIDELYASWFIETCPEWVVAYIADLIGVGDLPPELGAEAGVSRRAYVANTVAYRRRKGTVGVIEQVARDVSGWPARAVEFYGLLATATHVNHVRLDRPATAAVHTPAAAGGPLELVSPAIAQGALDPTPHTADVRRIASGRGRYGIPNIGAFLFGDQVYATGWCAARSSADPAHGWTVHPAGWDMPLYAAPLAEQAIETRATEANLPVPLRPRRLLAMLNAAREATTATEELPITVLVDDAVLEPRRLRVCGLEDLAEESGVPLPGWQVMIDAVRGRLHPYQDGAPATPAGMSTRHHYGGTADVGAGTHDRAATHEDVLAADPYRGDPARGGPGVTAQVAVLADDPDGLATPTVTAALAQAQTAFAGPDSPAGGTYVIAIGDSATYPGDLTIHVPEATRLVIVAASWTERVLGPGEVLPPVPGAYGPQGLRPHLAGTVTVSGDGGSSVVLDGLLIDGDLVVAPGALGSLAVSQCTVAGSVGIGVGTVTNPGLAVQVVRSIVGPISFGPAAAGLLVRDSAMDAHAFPDGADPAAITGEGVALDIDGSTVRGSIAVRSLRATSAILDGPVTVENRQTGCVRFSFVESTARVPRRYRCAPGPDDDPDLRPQYRAVDVGSPQYLTLAPTCPPQIASGGEDESEMGVHHHLHRPARVRAAQRLLAGYVPVGLEIGVAAQVATGRS